MTNNDLISLVAENKHYLKVRSPRDPQVLNAMRRVDRAFFLPRSQQSYAYEDEPLSIGYRQPCAKPSLVALITDLLDLKKSMNVLEIGTGCGYHAAIVAEVIGRKGHITSVEYIPQLARRARSNLAQHFGEAWREKVSVHRGDGSVGYVKDAPYDRIYLAAGVNIKSFKPELIASQLKSEGILLYPQEKGGIIKEKYSKDVRIYSQLCSPDKDGFWFVPLRGFNV